MCQIISPLSDLFKHQLLTFLEQLNDEDRLFFSPHTFSLDAIESILSSRIKDQYLVVHDAMGAVIGYCMLRGWDEGYSIPSIGICVSRSLRGRGLGKKLLAYLLQVAARFGASKAMLKVHRQNASAIKIYMQYGFRIEDSCGDHIIGFIDLEPDALELANRLSRFQK